MFPKFIFFDCDGVLTTGNEWRMLHHAVGLPDETDYKWYDEFYQGIIDYHEWNRRIEKFYKENGFTKKILEQTFSKISLNPEAIEIIPKLQKLNRPIAVISGGIDYYVQKAVSLLNISLWRTNYSFEFDKNEIISKLKFRSSELRAKVLEIRDFCNQYKIKPTETIFIGDSDNDLEAFDETKHGILYKNKDPKILKHSWKQIDNLKEILNLL